MTRSNFSIDFLQAAFRFSFRFACDIFFKGLYRSEVLGRENIPEKGGVLVASNHISGLETILIPYMALGRFTMRQFYAPAKEELFKFPPLAWFIRAGGAFPVRRGKGDPASREKISTLAKDNLVMIFPEGTRSRDGKLLSGKTGVGKIIYESRAPVVPTVVFNTNYWFPKGARSPNLFIPLKVVFGKPIDYGRYLKMPAEKSTYRAIVDDLMEQIGKLQREYGYLDIHAGNLIEGSGND